MTGILNALLSSGGAAGFTPTSTESGNFLTRATGITSTVDKTRYDTLISGLVTDTDFASLDALYIWAAPDHTTAQLNLVQSSYPSTEHGTVNFSAYNGYTGDGSTFYLDSGFSPDVAGLAGSKYTLNSASLGVYVQSNFTSGGASLECGGSDNVGCIRITPYFFTNSVWRVNSPSGRNIPSTTSQGFWIVTRTASGAGAYYRNGNTTAVDATTETSDFVPRSDILFFAMGGSTPSNFCTTQMNAGFIGAGLSSAAMARISARINTFMTAYGINVY